MPECPPPRKNGREPILGETHSRVPDEIEGIACRSVHHPGRMGGEPILGETHSRVPDEIEGIARGMPTTPEEWAGAHSWGDAQPRSG